MKRELPWFRLYSEAVDNEKLRLLAFEDRWHYIALLCLKNKGIVDESNSTRKVRKIAIKLGLTVPECEEVKRRLGEVGLVDDDYHPNGWAARQFVSDSSTERTRKHRQKQRAKKRNVSVTD